MMLKKLGKLQSAQRLTQSLLSQYLRKEALAQAEDQQDLKRCEFGQEVHLWRIERQLKD